MSMKRVFREKNHIAMKLLLTSPFLQYSMFLKNGTGIPESATHWGRGDSRSRRWRGQRERKVERKKQHERNIKRDMDMWETVYAIPEHFS